MSYHHPEVRSLRGRAVVAERADSNLEDGLRTDFSQCALLSQLVGECSAAFCHLLERLFLEFSRGLRKCLTLHRRQLCRSFSNFFFARDDSLKAIVAGLSTLTGCSVDAAAIVTKEPGSPDSSSHFRSMWFEGTAGTPSSVAPDADKV